MSAPPAPVDRASPVYDTLFLLATLACIVPVWIAPFPPMADLPQHAAQVALLFNLHDSAFAFRNLFDTHLFTPYLLGYGLIAAFTPAFGVLAACKLVVSIALAALPWTTRHFLRAAGADAHWAWLMFPVIYGFCYQWGFVSFLLAAPLGLVFLARVWRGGDVTGARAGLQLAALLVLLFFSHALILALFGAVAAAVWWLRDPRPRAFARVAWPLLTPLPLVVAWLASARGHPFNQFTIEWDLSWFDTIDAYYAFLAAWSTPDAPGWGRVSGFFPRLFGLRGEWVAAGLGLALFALPAVAGSRLSAEWRRRVPLLLVTGVLLLVPSLIHGVAFLFQRFTVLALPFFLLLFAAPLTLTRFHRVVRAAAPVIAFGWFGWMLHATVDFARDAEGFEAVLDHMEPGHRALSFVFEPDDHHSVAPVFVHFASWYTALKRGAADPSFARTQIQPVTYRADRVPTATALGFEWFPAKFDWAYHRGATYDYYLARAPVDPGTLLFRAATCTITLVTHAGHWWLYRRAANC